MESSPDDGLTAEPVYMRHTPQYRAVLAVLNELDDFRNVPDIHAALQERGERVALATVYRIMRTLTAHNQVDVVWAQSGDALYRRCGSGRHHHHLICRSCGEVIEVSGPDVEAWADQMASDHGFTNVGHSLEIVGMCGSCARRT